MPALAARRSLEVDGAQQGVEGRALLPGDSRAVFGDVEVHLLALLEPAEQRPGRRRLPQPPGEAAARRRALPLAGACVFVLGPGPLVAGAGDLVHRLGDFGACAAPAGRAGSQARRAAAIAPWPGPSKAISSSRWPCSASRAGWRISTARITASRSLSATASPAPAISESLVRSVGGAGTARAAQGAERAAPHGAALSPKPEARRRGGAEGGGA